MKGDYITPAQVKGRNAVAGHFFFSPGTMRFFNSRLLDCAREGEGGNWYFVTSERFDDNTPRMYTVRIMYPSGQVDEIGEFQQYASRNGAIGAMEKAAAEGALGHLRLAELQSEVRRLWNNTTTTDDMAQYIADHNITSEAEQREMYREFVRLFMEGVNAHIKEMQ